MKGIPEVRLNQTESGGAGALELVGLTKHYGPDVAVDRFNAKIAAGEFFSMLGPSGSGKTTTLMMIAGFAGVDEGQLLVDGKDVAKLPPQKRGFGMVFQNYAIFPHMTVFENVAFPLRARGVARSMIADRVKWALDMVQLTRYAERYSRQLSGGQLQRVAIARAIVFHPKVVLMDEPLGALDRNLRYAMQTEIKEIQQRLEMTVVYVTHDQEEALNMSDRIAILSNGRLQQLGNPIDVYQNPANSFTARFLGEANLLRGKVLRIEDGESVVWLSEEGAEFRALFNRGPGVGEACELFVRPEKIALSPCDATPGLDLNTMVGRIERVAFLGNTVRYTVVTPGRLSLTVDAQNGANDRLCRGDNIRVSWSATDSAVLGA
ncbi:hypothetical protein AN416_38040 (plasmid) [Paraburkholderia caribensis]|nr:hypothetical protein AN416_38040 [Paraburkholderia caribensis]